MRGVGRACEGGLGGRRPIIAAAAAFRVSPKAEVPILMGGVRRLTVNDCGDYTKYISQNLLERFRKRAIRLVSG